MQKEIKSFQEANELIAYLVIEHRKQQLLKVSQETFPVQLQVAQIAIEEQPLSSDVLMNDASTLTDPM